MAVTNYVWDPITDSVVHETNGVGATQVTYTGEPSEFGPLVSQRRESETSYHHCDGLSSTRELTNASEIVTDFYVHSAWGEEVAQTGTTVNPFRWGGRLGYYRDTGRRSLRSRMYSDLEGRFLSTDPLGLSSDDTNLYNYVRNTPINLVDPTGLVPIECECERDRRDVGLGGNTRWVSTVCLHGNYEDCCNAACGGGYSVFGWRFGTGWTGEWRVIGASPDVDAPSVCERGIPWYEMADFCDCWACCVVQNPISSLWGSEVPRGGVGGGGILLRPPLGIKPKGGTLGAKDWNRWRYHPSSPTTTSYRDVAVKCGVSSKGPVSMALKGAGYLGSWDTVLRLPKVAMMPV